MTRLWAVTTNTFLQTVRQPIYAIIVLVALGSFAAAPALTGWTLDDDNKMLRDIGLSTLLIQGLFLAAFSAAGVLSVEIEQKTVLTVAAKPLPRSLFVVGKYLGVVGAVAVAHYLAVIAFAMSMRHGVLQTSADPVDLTVLALGPGMTLLMLLAAAALNYLFDWKFLPTAVALLVPTLTASALILAFIDRDWRLKRFERTQTLDALPREITSREMLRGIVEFRPDEGKRWLPGARGTLVREERLGPVNDADREFLLNLSDDYQWRRQVDWLIAETRKITTPDIVKAAYLVFLAVALLCGVAVAASTRLGTLWTLVLCVLMLCVGFVTDHYLQPLDEQGVRWAQTLYRLLPNFQFFWMIDALADDRVIPWSYLGRVTAYAGVYCAGLVALAAALFETREVG